MGDTNYSEIYQTPPNNQQKANGNGNNNVKKKKDAPTWCLIAVIVFFVVASAIVAYFGGDSGTDTSPETETTTITPHSEAFEHECDILQTAFMRLSFDSHIADVEQIIADYNLEYTKERYNGTIKNIKYKLAYDHDVALQKYASSGDYLEVVFNLEDASIMYANYTMLGADYMNALLYNYGVYWDFSFRTKENNYSGYYYYKSGDSNKSGIEIIYDNGNSKKTSYYSCTSAKDALKKVLDLSANDILIEYKNIPDTT